MKRPLENLVKTLKTAMTNRTIKKLVNKARQHLIVQLASIKERLDPEPVREVVKILLLVRQMAYNERSTSWRLLRTRISGASARRTIPNFNVHHKWH